MYTREKNSDKNDCFKIRGREEQAVLVSVNQKIRQIQILCLLSFRLMCRTYTGKREGIRCIVLFLFYSVRIKRRSFQGKSSQSLKGQNIILCCLSGEPFNQEEMEDMLAIALDPESDTFHYRDYRKKLVVDETKTFPFNV